MPSHEEHCQDSLRRYGKRFDELHRWMDQPSAIMGGKHRMYRHDPYKTPQEAKLLFGPLADQACLDHIRLDRQESRRKGIGKMRISVRKARQSQISSSLALGFFSLISFLIGVALISTAPSTLHAIPFFFISFLLFLAFLGSEMQKENTLIQYTSHDLYPEGFPELKTFKICPNCGTSYDAKLENCPKCGIKLDSLTNNQRTS